jgi:2-keto-4-pentenoate hydratase/2-oxohepta-3-ene-1,7-dioic acid hydratase in catechol pathway
VDHEAELGIVIGRTATDLASPEAAAAHVFGATCVNDVTARDLQKKDVQFTRAKGFDTFCPVGPCLVTGLDLGGLRVTGRVNGEVRQRGSTADLIFDVPYLVWFVSRVMTLLPGDIISTGTPAGVGPLVPGDVVEVEVEGVGVLRNPVGER